MEEFQNLRISTQIQEEAERVLRAEGITPPVPIVSEKVGKGAPGNVALTTNLYGIIMKQVPVYRYDVKMSANLKKQDGSVKPVDLTKKVQGDAVLVDHRNRCRDIFSVFQEKQKTAFLKGAKCVYFDMQSILYSLNLLDVNEGPGVTFNIPTSEIGNGWDGFSSCDIVIRKVTDKFQLTLGDMSSVSRDLTQVDHSLAQFLDIATSQNVLFSPEHLTFSANTSFMLNHQKYGFRDSDLAAFQDNGSYLAVGVQKGVRFVEGPPAFRGRNAALVVETKKTPFHMVENLVQKASRLVRDIHNLRNGDQSKLDKTLAGLYVETKHLGRFNRFMVKGIAPENAKTKTFEMDGKQITVAQYFFDKYKISLKEPTLPLVTARGKDNSISYFPMELCTVVDNQRVKTNQQTSKQIQEMIKKCAVPPALLRDQTLQTFHSLDLKNSEYLANAQVAVAPNPLALSGNNLPAPDVEFRNNFVAKIRTDNFTWSGKNFLIPAGCKKWGAVALLSQQDRLLEPDFHRFLERFGKEASVCGMQIPRISNVKIFTSDQRRLKAEVEEHAKNGCDFILVIHPDSADEIHNALKLYEREYSIVTQAIRYGTLSNMIQKGQPMTLQNILNKTNLKMGGLNYSLSMNSPSARECLGSNTLYIGFGKNHPGGGLGGNKEGSVCAGVASSKLSAPTIIGYAANVGPSHAFEFVGDFVCQEPLRDEKVNIIRTIVTRCVQKYRENRKAEPKHVVLYRDGCGEGQFPAILKYEVTLIKNALQKAKCLAGLTVIVSNKLQSIRFFPKDIDPRAKASDQNIKPGMVVDHSVVHPEFSEFFLNSHRALQGTARTPKYTVLVNDDKFALDKLERITYQLCYGHQIVFMPTSLPSPVYIANRYAERGRKLYQAWIKNPPSDAKDAQMSESFGYMEMSKLLCYYGNKLFENRRINA